MNHSSPTASIPRALFPKTERRRAPRRRRKRKPRRVSTLLRQYEHRYERLANQRGVMLIEVLITIAIIALLSSALTFGYIKMAEKAKIDTAKNSLHNLKQVAEYYYNQNDSGECPTFEKLAAEGMLSDTAAPKDPWGKSWRIQCEAGKLSVSSGGPDRQRDTEDDIIVPKGAVAQLD